MGKLFSVPVNCSLIPAYGVFSVLRLQNKSSTFALKKTSDEGGGWTPEKYTKNEKLNQSSFFYELFV